MGGAHCRVGELIGGSQREEREDALIQRIKDMNLPQEQYEWCVQSSFIVVVAAVAVHIIVVVVMMAVVVCVYGIVHACVVK